MTQNSIVKLVKPLGNAIISPTGWPEASKWSREKQSHGIRGEVIGLNNAKKLLEDIPNKVKDVLGIIVDVNIHHTEWGDFLEIITEAHPYPVNYKGQYHYRSGSTKQELKGSALDKFLLQKKGKRWDGVPIPKVSIEDLKSETFDHFRKKAVKAQRIEDDVLTDTNDHLLDNLQLLENKYLKISVPLINATT